MVTGDGELAQRGDRLGVVGVLCEHGLEFRARLVEASHGLQCIAEIAARVDVSRIDAQRLAETRDRSVGPVQMLVGHAERDVQFRRVRP